MTQRPLSFETDGRGQVMRTPPILYVTMIGATILYVGIQIYQEMQAEVSPVGAETYCGGCGFLPEAAGAIALVVVLLLAGIALAGRAWMRGGFASDSGGD